MRNTELQSQDTASSPFQAFSCGQLTTSVRNEVSQQRLDGLSYFYIEINVQRIEFGVSLIVHQKVGICGLKCIITMTHGVDIHWVCRLWWPPIFPISTSTSRVLEKLDVRTGETWCFSSTNIKFLIKFLQYFCDQQLSNYTSFQTAALARIYKKADGYFMTVPAGFPVTDMRPHSTVPSLQAWCSPLL